MIHQTTYRFSQLSWNLPISKPIKKLGKASINPLINRVNLIFTFWRLLFILKVLLTTHKSCLFNISVKYFPKTWQISKFWLYLQKFSTVILFWQVFSVYKILCTFVILKYILRSWFTRQRQKKWLQCTAHEHQHELLWLVNDPDTQKTILRFVKLKNWVRSHSAPHCSK